MSDHEIYMTRCLVLAQRGLGYVAPNPMVGAVIVYNGKIIGEGYHQKYGDPHAEVNAINSVADHELLKKATLYVNLEPCAHWGKTPPCADLIIEKQIPHVVIGCKDVFEEVNGRGIAKLNDAEIKVETGILEKESLEMNRQFFVSNQKKRPYIILKWAQTADGFLAREDHSSKWISNAYSRLLSHRWRAEEAAIMVGTNTAIYDNPQLSSRDMKTKNPVRIILDKTGKIPETHHVCDGSQQTIIFTSQLKPSKENLDFVQIDFDENHFPENILTHLYNIGIQSVIIEGGAKLLQTFTAKNLWDEARVFTAKDVVFRKGVLVPDLKNEPVKSIDILNDRLSFYSNL